MAEALARAALAERLPGAALDVRSAGTLALPGGPAAREARDVAAGHGLDLDGHRASPLTPELLRRARLVPCMTESHRRVAAGLGAGERAVLLCDYLPPDDPLHGRDVPDPMGGGREEYEEAYATLERAVGGLVDALASDAEDGEGAEEGEA